MKEYPPPIDAEAEELQLLYTDPHALAKKLDGKRPLVAPLLQVPKGFVVNGTEFPIHGVALPFKPEGEDSAVALKAQLHLAELREKYGHSLFFISVKTREGYPYAWSFGPILPEDLNRDIASLKTEAIEAVKGNDTLKASMKLRAIFAQLPWSQRSLAPRWEEVFIVIDSHLPPETKKESRSPIESEPESDYDWKLRMLRPHG